MKIRQLINPFFGFFYILFALSTPWTSAATKFGNGGEFIYCVASSENNFQGYYFIDHLAGLYLKPETLSQAGFDEIILKIEKNLIQIKKKYASAEKIYKDLESFIQSWERRNTQKNKKTHLRYNWIATEGQYIKKMFSHYRTQIETIQQLVPENCLYEINHLQLNPVAIREDFNNKTTIEYDQEILIFLFSQGDENFHWFLLHEWLWSYVKDGRQNAMINVYFHSKQFLKDSPEQMLQAMVENGFEAN